MVFVEERLIFGLQVIPWPCLCFLLVAMMKHLKRTQVFTDFSPVMPSMNVLLAGLSAAYCGGIREWFRKWVACAMFWLLLSRILPLRWGCCHLGGLSNWALQPQRPKVWEHFSLWMAKAPVIQFSSLFWHQCLESVTRLSDFRVPVLVPATRRVYTAEWAGGALIVF